MKSLLFSGELENGHNVAVLSFEEEDELGILAEACCRQISQKTFPVDSSTA
jgi:hypothetical protein